MNNCNYNLWDPIFIVKVIISIKFLFPESGFSYCGISVVFLILSRQMLG